MENAPQISKGEAKKRKKEERPCGRSSRVFVLCRLTFLDQPKYLSSSPSNALPCLASSRAQRVLNITKDL